MEDSQSSSTLDIRGLPRDLKRLKPLINLAAHAIFEQHKVASFAISIAFVNDSKISKINRESLGRDGPTDVIAFDLSEDGLPFEKVADIYVSTDRASENSLRYGVSFEEEILRLVIHGLLHVLGYRDDTVSSKRKMHRIQEQLVRRYLGGVKSRRNQ